MKIIRSLSFFFIVCLVAVSGCAPQMRLQRLLTTHPELRAYTKQDSFLVLKTLYIDTTLVPVTDNFIIETQIDSFFQLLDTCINRQPRTANRQHLTQLFKEKKCLEQPLLFTDTIIYADKEIEILLPVTVVVTQEANAFNISVQGTGGRVLSNSKAVAVTALTVDDIVKYRKQGAWMVGGPLIGLLILCALAYGGYKIYAGKYLSA